MCLCMIVSFALDCPFQANVYPHLDLGKKQIFLGRPINRAGVFSAAPSGNLLKLGANMRQAGRNIGQFLQAHSNTN